MDAQQTPVATVLIQTPASVGPGAMARALAAHKPPAARWIWLASTAQPAPERTGIAAPSPGLLDYRELAGGCACCAARPALAQALVRVLRARPWDLLVLEARGSVHAAGMVDVLQAAPFAAFFELLPPVAVLDAASAPGDWPAERALTPIVLAPPPEPGTEPSGHTVLLEGAVAPCRVLQASAGRVPWVALQTEWAQHRRALQGRVSQWSDPLGQGWAWHWPPTQRWDRRRLEVVLAALCQPGGALAVAGLQRARGVFRTARAWYRWSWPDSATLTQETTWRVDNRWELVVESPIDPHIIDTALQSAHEGPGPLAVASVGR